MGHEFGARQFVGRRWRPISDPPAGSVVRCGRRDWAQRLWHLQLQSGSELRSVRRARQRLVVQLLFLQQEEKAYCVLHMPRHQVRIGLHIIGWVEICIMHYIFLAHSTVPTRAAILQWRRTRASTKHAVFFVLTANFHFCRHYFLQHLFSTNQHNQHTHTYTKTHYTSNIYIYRTLC